MGEVKISNIPQGHHLKMTHCEGFEKIWYMGYYFRWPTSDYMSKQIMNFKRGDLQPREAFCDLTAQEFNLLGRRFDYITRVLGSNELVAKKGSKVAAIAKKIYGECGGQYDPTLFRKNRPVRELKYLNKEERRTELEGVYELYNKVNLNEKKVLIVDDVFTFGTSFEAIGSVIREKNPDVRLFGFALVHNWHKGDGGIFVNEPAFVSRYNKAFAKAA